MTSLYMEYRRKAKRGMSFLKYLESIGFSDPSVNINGMDDMVLAQPAVNRAGVELIAIPEKEIQGELRIIVLLVDFSDRPGEKEPGHYEDLLFSENKHPTGSMRDYYAEVSNGKVLVTGSVHGWLRMPHPYSHYVNKRSGMGTHPNNCQALAEDAAQAALAAGVTFPVELDKLQRGFVTAFFIVHAGRGAEKEATKAAQAVEIWSHKWNVENPVEVGPGLSVTTYLVVPQNCRLGVCAHELGHLAFQWQDFYDPNSNDDNAFWNGSGDWDLMASGCYNFGEARPAHPAGLHKVQHGWVPLLNVQTSQDVTLKPSTAPGGRICKIRSPALASSQYLLLESRPKRGFDAHLPGEGLLVWRVDESKEMFAPATPGMQLVQADGRDELEMPDPSMQGDDGDPFPGGSGIASLKDLGSPSTSFQSGRSGITLSNIVFDDKGVATFSVNIKPLTASSGPLAVKVARAKAAAKGKNLSGKSTPKPPLVKSSASVDDETGELKPKRASKLSKVVKSKTPPRTQHKDAAAKTLQTANKARRRGPQ